MHTPYFQFLVTHHLLYRNWLHAGNLLPQTAYKNYSFISPFKRYRSINPQCGFLCSSVKPPNLCYTGMLLFFTQDCCLRLFPHRKEPKENQLHCILQ